MENIVRIRPFDSMLPGSFSLPERPSRRNRKRQPHRDTRRRFSALSRLADDTHLTLTKADAPFRLCVYQEDSDILMDVVALDPDRNVGKRYSRTITQNRMTDLVRRIHTGSGLVCDYSL